MLLPCRMRGLQLVDSWSSRLGEPFAGLPKCFKGAGQKEVSCAGQRTPARATRAALGGGTVSLVSVVWCDVTESAILDGLVSWA